MEFRKPDLLLRARSLENIVKELVKELMKDLLLSNVKGMCWSCRQEIVAATAQWRKEIEDNLADNFADVK